MIILTKKNRKTKLDDVIEAVILKLEGLSPDSKEYQIIADNLERLYKARSYEKSNFVSPDTLAIIGGNLLGIALILWFEKTDVITSKALGFVLKGRV
jgi:hypothetical protein